MLRQCSPYYAYERIDGGERVEGRGVDVQEVHFFSVRQAEQRNNEEEHGAKRGVRGLYKLGQRVLTESPQHNVSSNAISICCSSLNGHSYRRRRHAPTLAGHVSALARIGKTFDLHKKYASAHWSANQVAIG